MRRHMVHYGSAAGHLRNSIVAACLEFPRVLWESFLFFIVVVSVWAVSALCIYTLVAKASAPSALPGELRPHLHTDSH